MPRYGRFKQKRTFRRKKKFSKKFGKKLLRDARTRGVNSAAELAVQIIAKKEAKKLMAPNLLFRRTILGDYDRATNVFSVGTAMDMDGVCIAVAQIPSWDIQTMATTVPLADPNLRPPTPVYDRGTNVLAAGVGQDGYRNSSKITIFNMGCELRFTLAGFGGAAPPRREDVTVRYAIMGISSPDAFALGWQPAVSDAMPYKGLGYSSRLDEQVADEINDTRRKIFKQGKITLKYSELYSKERFRSLFWSGKLPYAYQSAQPAPSLTTYDQNGQRVVSKWKVFLIVRSDTPVGDPLYTKVLCNGFIKVGYKNVS